MEMARVLDVLAGVVLAFGILSVVAWLLFVTLTARWPAWLLVLGAALAWAFYRALP